MQVAGEIADSLPWMEESRGADMNDRTLVALDTDDSYFNDWLIDLFSLERRASVACNDKMWTGVKPTYTGILIREN
jgi:hypothetical protein